MHHRSKIDLVTEIHVTLLDATVGKSQPFWPDRLKHVHGDIGKSVARKFTVVRWSSYRFDELMSIKENTTLYNNIERQPLPENAMKP